MESLSKRSIAPLAELDREPAASGRRWPRPAANEEPEIAERLERVLVRSGEHWIVVRLAAVDWIEGDGNHVVLHAGGRRHRVRRTLDGIETQLDPRQFVRIHRSSIVNLERVVELSPALSGSYFVRLDNGARLVLSRTHRDRLLARLGKL
jgi:two-component system LytT family response regulator